MTPPRVTLGGWVLLSRLSDELLSPTGSSPHACSPGCLGWYPGQMVLLWTVTEVIGGRACYATTHGDPSPSSGVASGLKPLQSDS